MSANQPADTAPESAEVAGAGPARPLLRVVKGNPTDADLAVLVAVFSAATTTSGAAESGPIDDWGSPSDALRPAWPNATGFLRGRW
ncbi:MAG: acyl-CoA carboxylase subunit epsilon [Gordonia sp. (in: high G+C Gram-positive bacteria)]